MKNMLKELVLNDYLAKLSSSDPVPGGGAASAISGATAAGLVAMVAALTSGKKNYEDSWKMMDEVRPEALKIQEELTDLADKDADSYQAVLDCFKMPKDTDEEKAARSKAIQTATLEAAKVPLRIAELSSQIFGMAKQMVLHGNKNAVSDGAVAALLARAAVHGAVLNVLINAGSLKDENAREDLRKRCEELRKMADQQEAEILKLTNL